MHYNSVINAPADIHILHFYRSNSLSDSKEHHYYHHIIIFVYTVQSLWSLIHTQVII